MTAALQGPSTHYELFAGLRRAEVSWLITGDVALVLHGVPRLSADIDLAVDPEPGNIARLERQLSSWGYAQEATDRVADIEVRRFRHPLSALAEIDVVVPSAAEYARLRPGSAVVHLVDQTLHVVGAIDMYTIKRQAGTEEARDDATSLDVLAAVREGRQGPADDNRWEQIRKFSRWSVAARLDWLLSTARLARGMAPEARPMTRGLTRRRDWYGR